MTQILFGIGSDMSKANWLNNAFRSLFGIFDLVVYTIITFVYQILFAIADSGIISSEYMAKFYNRFQVILGVFMIFKLAISVLQYVVNPDLMSDKKQGLSNVITRIVTMLAMLMAIMPLNIPDSNAPAGSYNAYLNENGLLFGTMYSLQSRILKQGVIEKLILGDKQLITGNEDSTLGDTPGVSDDTNSSIDIEQSANKLAVGILKVFIRPNLKDVTIGKTEDNYVCCANGTGLGCVDIDGSHKDWLEIYNDESIDPAMLIELLNVSCGKLSTADNRYALSYMPIIPTLCGALILWVLITFCIEIAKRAIRLAILRLIAPIPIISYVDPKSSEKGAFAAWTKELVTAFLQLFLALAIIFFTINIVTNIMNAIDFVGGENWDGAAEGIKSVVDLPNPLEGGFSAVNSLAIVFIVVAIFLFAREAPRFIMNSLGIKGTGYGLGFAGALGGLGAMMEGAGLRGLVSGSANAMQDASDAYVQGKAAPPAFGSQADRVRQLLTGDKNAHGGVFGRWQREANDLTNQSMARHYLGLDRNVSGQAKTEMYALKSIASGAEEKYKRFATGNMSDEERTETEASTSFTQYMSKKGINYAALSPDEQRHAMAQYLEDDWGSKQTAANKQEAWYNDSAKLLESFGINETLQEKYSTRGEGAYRASRMYSSRRPGYDAPVRGHRGYALSHQYRTTAGKSQSGAPTMIPGTNEIDRNDVNGPQSNV